MLCCSRAAATDGVESTRDTAPSGLQSDAGHTPAAVTDHAQELPYLSVVRLAAPRRATPRRQPDRHSPSDGRYLSVTRGVFFSPVLLLLCTN